MLSRKTRYAIMALSILAREWGGDNAVPMRRVFFTAAILLCVALPLSAQKAFDPAESRDEISFNIGLMTPMQRGLDGLGHGTDLSLQLDYRHFWRSGLGVRSGIVFLPDYQGFENTFGIPVALVWRTGSTAGRARLDRGLNSAGSTIRNAQESYSSYDSASMLRSGAVSFLMGLFDRAEFYAGLTPGWIPGTESIYRRDFGGGWEESGMQKPHSLSLTADAGVALTYRIWRFNLRLMPAFHYSLIGNYRDYSAQYLPAYPRPIERTKDIRWHFSLQFGLGFLL